MQPENQANGRQLIDVLESNGSVANSPIMLAEGRQAIVQLDPDHPGFNDPDYRQRRNDIAQIALDYKPPAPIPDAPYSDAEHGVWTTICTEMEPAHASFACSAYQEYAAKLQLPSDRIPQLQDVSDRIHALSGFRLEPVAGLVHPKVFLATMARGAFLATQYIRHHSTPSYTPEPDVVHELVGHAAQLANPAFAELNRAFGRAALALSSGDAFTKLSRVYWFSLEFGVLREGGALKAYGAGLLSSFGELTAMEQADIRPLDPIAMEEQDYDVTAFQPVLYCADSFDSMLSTLTQYCARLQA